MQNKINPHKITYLSVKILSGNLRLDETIDTNSIKSYESKVKITNGLDRSSNSIIMTLNISILAMDYGNKQLPTEATYELEHIFKIENLEDFLIPLENQEIIVEAILGQVLLGMAYSTTRGILHARLQGTSYDGCLLPVISPGDLIEKSELHLKDIQVMKKTAKK